MEKGTCIFNEHISQICQTINLLSAKGLFISRISHPLQICELFCLPSPELQITCVKQTSIDTNSIISWPNPMLDLLLESSRWDDSNKRSSIGFSQEMGILGIKIRTLSWALLHISQVKLHCDYWSCIHVYPHCFLRPPPITAVPQNSSQLSVSQQFHSLVPSLGDCPPPKQPIDTSLNLHQMIQRLKRYKDNLFYLDTTFLK